jgi:hypothetical protein
MLFAPLIIYKLLFYHVYFNLILSFSQNKYKKKLSLYFFIYVGLTREEEILQVFDNKLPRINLDLEEVELGTE